MVLEQGNIYHLYNQGNNHGAIFFRNENYSFFLKKIKHHICPYADILAYCLMPNHFHLIIAVKTLTLSDRLTMSHHATFNSAIATMLRSYTRAINIQEQRTGSLFREGTKAEWLGTIESEKLKYQNRNKTKAEAVQNSDEEYLMTCFRYIHDNPVKAGLTQKITDWEFSSAQDLAGIGSKSIINKRLRDELGLQVEVTG